MFVVCEYGQFEFECIESCHCNKQTCDPRTGACPPDGCQRGYAGITCSMGMYDLLLTITNIYAT